MASWTDKPIQFQSYVPENPVDAMLAVGITRQQKYEQGLQKAETYMSSLNGLDIQKPEIREYVQGKISELYRNINNVSGDFSDHRLVNQIGGAASKIANDPVITNGIAATQTIRSIQQQIEQARKDGKSAVENEWAAQSAINNWLNDGQYDTQLNASFNPYFDIQKKIREIYKDMSDGQDLPGDALRINPDGSVVPNEVLKEGISVSRLKSAVDVVMNSPDAQRQLAITGAYTYQGLNGEAMYDQLETSTKTNLEKINSAIKSAQVSLAAATGAQKTAYANEIKSLQSQAKSLTDNFSYLVKGLETNVDGVKKTLVQQDLSSNMISALAHNKLVKNPLWETWFQQQQLEWTKFKDTEDLNIKKLAKEKENKDANISYGAVPMSETEGKKNEATFNEILAGSANKLDGQKKSIVYDYVNLYGDPNRNPYIWDDKTQQLIPNTKVYGKKEDVEKETNEILAKLRTEKQYNGMAGDPNLAAKLNDLDDYETEFLAIKAKKEQIESQFAPNLEKIKKAIGNEDFYLAYLIKEKLPGWETAETNLKKKYEKYNGDWEVGLGLTTIGYGVNTPTRERGKNWNAYKKAISNIDRQDLTSSLQQQADAFRSAQTGYQSTAAFFPVGKPEIRSNVIGALSASSFQSMALPGKQKIESVMKILGDEKKYPNSRPYVYLKYDNDGNKVAVVGALYSGGKTEEGEISYDDFVRNFSGLGIDDRVLTKYGTRLSLNGGENTGITGPNNTLDITQRTAFTKVVGVPGDQYTLNYHFIKDRSKSGQFDPKYNIKLWISRGNDKLVDGQIFTIPTLNGPMDLQSADNQIENVLSRPELLRQYLISLGINPERLQNKE